MMNFPSNFLKNREFESLRLRVWSKIEEKKRELEKSANLEPRICEGLVYLQSCNFLKFLPSFKKTLNLKPKEIAKNHRDIV